MKLLKIGGRIVYSTCSLNPVENEAVVLEIWRQARGAIRLVDVSQQFPDLSRGNGLSSWVVTDAENHVIPAENADSMEHSAVKRSFFPPSEAERADAHPEFAMRFLPHVQNRGGFFVCVLEKTAEVSATFGEFCGDETLAGLVKCEQQWRFGGRFIGRTLASRRREAALENWRGGEEARRGLSEFYGIEETFDWQCVYSRGSANHVGMSVRFDVDAVFGASNGSLALFNGGIDGPGAPHRAQNLRALQSERRVPLPTLPRRPPSDSLRASEARRARGLRGLAGFAGQSDGSEAGGRVQRGVSSENGALA